MRVCSLLLATAWLPLVAQAELKLPAIIGDNMVLQQKQTNPIWGWDTAGTHVTVQFGAQSKSGTADASGKWTVKLDPVPASAQPATMTIKGTTSRTLANILVGEVWLCSGQSNMGFTVGRTRDADVEMLGSKHPNIRLISVPNVGTQIPQNDFVGKWDACTPETVKEFSAVGFFYGRLLHQMLDVPVGLIDNAWGGSACEAWVRRDLLEKDARFKDMIARWQQTEATYDFAKVKAAYTAGIEKRKQQVAEARKAGKPVPAFTPGRPPRDEMTGNHRPGNLYAGCLHPIIGYGIKGAIWYQGESNASRAHEYGYLFPMMIQHWRDEWKSGDFPFYWVQLADYRVEATEPGDSDWAELRESQTKTQNVIKNGGQAVIIDIGEGKDIHPTNKRDVAERLARLALAKDYGVKIPYRSPEFKTAAFDGGKATVTIDTFGSSLNTFDVAEIRGFAVCGEDKKWVWAEGKIVGPDKVEVVSKTVTKPVAVRYAWSDNPVCNLYSKEGLPVTPFRSDNFPMITDPASPNNPVKVAAERAEALKKFLAGRQAQQAAKKAKAEALPPKTTPAVK